MLQSAVERFHARSLGLPFENKLQHWEPSGGLVKGRPHIRDRKAGQLYHQQFRQLANINPLNLECWKCKPYITIDVSITNRHTAIYKRFTIAIDAASHLYHEVSMEWLTVKPSHAVPYTPDNLQSDTPPALTQKRLKNVFHGDTLHKIT